MTDQLKRFWDFQAYWSRITFGPDQQRGPRGPLEHLEKEVAEAKAKPFDLVEYADCQHLIFDAARRAGYTYEQFVEACFNKLAINMNRKWQKSTDDAPVEHVREEDPYSTAG